MNAHPHHGTSRPGGEAEYSSAGGGFTLLEMCIVLFIIALLALISLPALGTAFTEQALRKDSHQLALMVKTGMIQAAEQHRPYVIDLTGSSAQLHPLGDATAPAAEVVSDAALFADSGSKTDTGPVLTDVTATDEFDSENKLLTPDVSKANSWLAMPGGTSWVFQPGELCPATRVRINRGESYVEMSFNALTGNVENEASFFP